MTLVGAAGTCVWLSHIVEGMMTTAIKTPLFYSDNISAIYRGELTKD